MFVAWWSIYHLGVVDILSPNSLRDHGSLLVFTFGVHKLTPKVEFAQ
jgi:hypothetical protein